MAPGRKSKREIAEDATERHERLYDKTLARRGRPGITKMRIKLSEALHARMRAELKAGMNGKNTEIQD